MKSDQAAEVSLFVDVITAEVVFFGDSLAPPVGTGPILAEESTLVSELAGVLGVEADPMASGEEKGRCGTTAEQFCQAGLARIFAEIGLNIPALLPRGESRGIGSPLFVEKFSQGFDEVLKAP
jgi:hypothetical protein